tara:strand:+ start:2235 stop:2402 length:168 start_codon:yes stop_codon:yes gene_type:complete
MTKIKSGKAVCHICGKPAKLFYKLWWCGVSSDTGVYNLIGVCDDKRKRSSKKKSS